MVKNKPILFCDFDGTLCHAKKYNVPIQDCVLFDDSKNTCKVFTELGGSAYLVNSDQNFFSQLKQL